MSAEGIFLINIIYSIYLTIKGLQLIAFYA